MDGAQKGKNSKGTSEHFDQVILLYGCCSLTLVQAEWLDEMECYSP